MARYIELFERDGKTVCWDSKRKLLVAVQTEVIALQQEAIQAIEVLVAAAEENSRYAP